ARKKRAATVVRVHGWPTIATNDLLEPSHEYLTSRYTSALGKRSPGEDTDSEGEEIKARSSVVVVTIHQAGGMEEHTSGLAACVGALTQCHCGENQSGENLKEQEQRKASVALARLNPRRRICLCDECFILTY
ncbi:hypothetical protein CSUI_000439, partial [Cystoisospora suis]